MKRIKQLSKNLVNQIAAGEVIERPMSVVKELVENSIDAGATKIEIAVSNDCRNIRIADNGSGIHPDDIELAFSKHATSKIDVEEDLFNIQSLGFRGEALASIISVAKVTCTTRTKDFEYGTRVESQNSEVKKTQTGCAIGTIMEVEDLFFNQPARLKFLKTAKTEFLYIQEVMNSIVLANPEVAFVLKNNNSVVINTTSNADLLTRLSELYSYDCIESLREVNKSDNLSDIGITGYTSIPSFTRSSRKSIYTFINSRIIKCPVIFKAIDTAYRNMLPSGKYPFVVVNLKLNPEEVDVNAHPNKMEVRYKNPNQIFQFVYSSIQAALSNINYKNDIEPTQSVQTEVMSFASKFEENSSVSATYVSENKFDTQKTVFPVNAASNYESEQQKIDMDFDAAANNEPKINIVGQFKDTYILIENEDSLEIVDQHIADERYLYELLMEKKECASQLLLISDVIDLEHTDVDILLDAKEKLAKFGYKVEKIADNQIVFKEIPQMLSHVKPQDIATELLENIKGDFSSLEEKIIITTACKAAVKAGQKLSIWQMEELIKKLRTTKNPYSCPHGRPISKVIPEKDVASFFLRN